MDNKEPAKRNLRGCLVLTLVFISTVAAIVGIATPTDCWSNKRYVARSLSVPNVGIEIEYVRPCWTSSSYWSLEATRVAYRITENGEERIYHYWIVWGKIPDLDRLKIDYATKSEFVFVRDDDGNVYLIFDRLDKRTWPADYEDGIGDKWLGEIKAELGDEQLKLWHNEW
ncbi:MAG: hypothetical protein GC159_04475 [Phycisphaera sp.]|nr:hypothetical protein [Phycisphaera sp.]